MTRAWRLGLICFAATLVATVAAVADDSADADDSGAGLRLPRVVVVAASPLPGAENAEAPVASSTQVIGADGINRTGIPSLTGALLAFGPSTTLNDTEGNVFQPDILFRGFTASPVAGTPQGLAVYVNGVRFNDAFGDTLNWDLIPPTAIESVQVEASNPVFGLNALGGALAVRLKSGFSTQTASMTAYGGSFGRASDIIEFGAQSGALAIYTTLDVTHDDGFRRTGKSDLLRNFTDLGWRGERAEVHLGITAAHDTLDNPGATPVQALAADLSNVFTAPNEVDNKYVAAHLRGELQLDASTSLQGLGYYQRLRQYVPNGITTQVAACPDGSGLLCNSDGSVVTTTNGQAVTDFLNGGYYSGLSVQRLDSHAYGLAAQASSRGELAGHSNRLIAGLTWDGSESVFAGEQLLGGFDPYSRDFLGPGVVLDQPDAGINPVQVRSVTRYLGIYAADVWSLTSSLDLNVRARFNRAAIRLDDQLGGPVNGAHTYQRLNPSTGFEWRIMPTLHVYANYAETNRAPTPQELSCASAAAPCSLLNFFVGDPNLDQVVARTVELGVRGQRQPTAGTQLRWDMDLFRTANTHDIIYEPTVYDPNLAFYTNAGRTLRQGLEANLHLDAPRWRLSLGYAFTDATFRTPLQINSPDNPAADVNGQIAVQSGNHLPGIPRHRANLVLDLDLTAHWSAGLTAVTQSSAWRFGDEANLTAPVPGYTVFDLNTMVHLGAHLSVFAVVNNVLDRRFYTYGAFGPVGDVPWPNIPGGVSDPRTASPGTPRAAFGGLRYQF